MTGQITSWMILLWMSLVANPLTAVAQISDDAHIVDKIERLISAEASQNAAFGISVRATDGRSVYEHNAKSRLIPASTFKLITTLSAVGMLGPDHRYETRVGYRGEVLTDGTLVGDIVIIGSGDPSLGSPQYDGAPELQDVLQRIIQIIKGRDISCIDGDIIIDDSIFDNKGVHPSWSWDDLTNYYASGAYGLNIHENFYFLDFGRSSSPHQLSTIYEIRPSVPLLRIRSDVTTGEAGTGDNAYIYGDPYSYDRRAEGTIPPGQGVFTIKGALPHPAEFLAYHLRAELMHADVSSQGYRIERINKADFVETGRISSTTLKDLTSYANEISNNLYCEAFLKTIGASVSGTGSFDSGVSAVTDYLNSLGLNISGIHMQDGSGLSARNRISPDFMTAFLHIQMKQMGISALKSYIPRTGHEGSVRRFLNDRNAQGRAWLKSGSINNVLAYSGLLESRSGEVYLISIMANGHHSNRSLRGQMEKMIEVFFEEL